ncbi:MAG: GNAT family N-acetyltransferase [Sandaracinaceae bacterium]
MSRLASSPFETEITGHPMGRLTVTDEPPSLEELVARARTDGMRHLVATVDATAYDTADALAGLGFALVDVGVTFARAPEPGRGGHPRVREATLADRPDIEARCAPIFRTSRYYRDSFFTEAQADEVHRRWIANSFAGRAARIFVADDDAGRAGGFITLLVDDAARVGRIELLGVATDAGGRGLGAGLVDASLGWLAGRVERVLVKTQSTNFRAANVYERAGFVLAQSDLTYSLRL